MTTAEIIDVLAAKASELSSPFPMEWRWIQHCDVDVDAVGGLQVTGDEPVWSKERNIELCKGAKNWFYADLTYPAAKNAIPLAGTSAIMWINGYAPFTLWIDGEEAFRESHVWHATGPISDPLPLPIEPGRTHRFVIAMEPTDTPNGVSDMLAASVHSRAAIELGIVMSAAANQLRFAVSLAETDDERLLVDNAALSIDNKALAADRWPEVEESIGAMESMLAPLSQRAKAHTLHLIGHTHIDMDWMWTWDDTVHCIRRDFKAVVDIMRDYPEVKFTNSQIPTYAVAKEMDPAVFERVRSLIAEGRWEVAAATWVEGDLNMADGESIARQMLYAADWARENLGKAASIYWAPDNFGHPGNMPQIATLGEKDSYFQWRCNPGRDDNWPVRTWTGIDGTAIASFASGYGGSIDPGEVVGMAMQYRKFGLKSSHHIWGNGDHGGALSRFRLELLKLFRDRPLIPTIRFSTMAQHLADIRAEGVALPANTGETYSLFEGCFTTHAQIKKYNRQCEGALLTAETLAALAGIDARDRLRDAWTGILFNQFHDIFCGASVHDAYTNAYARAEAAVATAKSVADEAAAILGDNISAAPSTSSVTLVNPLGFARTEPVRISLPDEVEALVDAAGSSVPIQRLAGEAVFIVDSAPAFGASTLTATAAIGADEDGTDDSPSALGRGSGSPRGGPGRALREGSVQVTERERDFLVETNHSRLSVSKDSGCIGSYYDKALEREFVAYGVPKTLTHIPTTRTDLALNVFTVLDEAPNTMSAWLINDILREEHLLRGADVSLVETGPVFARFRVKHKFRASSIDEEIIIYNDYPRVDFVATVDWRERGNETVGVPQLKVSFATGLTAVRARFEGPFTVVERPADGTEQPTQKFVDVTGDSVGFALYNDSKYGCDVLGGRARITLLRNPYGPDAEPDNGIHTVRFAFEPHGPRTTNGELVRRGMAFNRPFVAAPSVSATTGSSPYLTIDGADSVVCSSLRRAEHSDRTLLRLWETSGMPATARISLAGGIADVREVNFLESPTGNPLSLANGIAACEFHPFEIKTLSIRRD